MTGGINEVRHPSRNMKDWPQGDCDAEIENPLVAVCFPGPCRSGPGRERPVAVSTATASTSWATGAVADPVTSGSGLFQIPNRPSISSKTSTASWPSPAPIYSARTATDSPTTALRARVPGQTIPTILYCLSFGALSPLLASKGMSGFAFSYAVADGCHICISTLVDPFPAVLSRTPLRDCGLQTRPMLAHAAISRSI